MRKLFYSMAIALVALMVSIPAKAGRVFEANTLNELFGLLCQGYSATHDCVEPDDTIRLNANITYSTGVTDNVYLFIPANTTRTLDLNGKTLKSLPTLTSSTDANVIEMHDNSTLNICDTQGGGMIINDSQVHFVDEGIDLHTVSFEREMKSDRVHEGIGKGAQVIAYTIAEIFSDPARIAQIKATHTFTPLSISMTATAPPNEKAKL